MAHFSYFLALIILIGKILVLDTKFYIHKTARRLGLQNNEFLVPLSSF